MLTAADLASPALKTVTTALKTVEESMLRLSDALTGKYLVHSAAPRPFGEAEGRT
jgi:hypothetical protein